MKSFYVLEIGFQNSFVKTAAAFQHGLGSIITKPWKAAKKFIRILRKILFFLKDFSLTA
jgi:hypothetical protein